MKRLILISSFCTLISCMNFFSEKDILGMYAPRDYQYSFDTIIIKKDGVYERRVYDVDNHLVLEMKGKWRFTNNLQTGIQFYSFFLNLDRDLKKYPELLSDTIDWPGYLERENGGIQFCVGLFSASMSNQNCYHKIKE